MIQYMILANTMEGTTVLGPYTDRHDVRMLAQELSENANYDNAFIFELGNQVAVFERSSDAA